MSYLVLFCDRGQLLYMQIKGSATPNLADKFIMTSLIRGVASDQLNFGVLHPLSCIVAPLSPKSWLHPWSCEVSSHYMSMANLFLFHTIPPAQLPEPVYSPHAPHYQGMHQHIPNATDSYSFPDSSPEYRMMMSRTTGLSIIISSCDLQRICQEIMEACRIKSRHMQDFINNSIHTKRTKATKLVDFMTYQVKTSPSNFEKFMAVLKKSDSMIEGILRIYNQQMVN